MSARTQEVFIYANDDLARIGDLKRLADTAARHKQFVDAGGSARIGGDASPEEAADDLKAFVAEAATRAERVVVSDIGNRRWRALLSQHRPRYVRRMINGDMQDVIDEDDAGYNVNMETFVDALLKYADPNSPGVRTIIEPEFPTTQARDEWFDGLSGGDFDKLFLTAYALNGRQTVDPKELLDSLSSFPSSTSTWE